MVEFLSKSDSRGIKIAQVNSIRMTKSIKKNYFLRAVPRGEERVHQEDSFSDEATRFHSTHAHDHPSLEGEV